MLERQTLPDLTFPSVEFGADEWRWNLQTLLYVGGAGTNLRLVNQAVASGRLGKPDLARVELIVKIHDVLQVNLSNGGSRESARSGINALRYFVDFSDRFTGSVDVETVTETYCAWADLLLHRTRIKRSSLVSGAKLSPLKPKTAYTLAAVVGTLLDRALERRSRIIELTRLYHPGHRKTAVGVQAEKQSLADTFDLGHLLQDICDALTLKVTLEAPSPVRIRLRSGKEIIRHATRVPGNLNAVGSSLPGERATLANLRMEAELLMLIGQTGMNLAQAVGLKLRHFLYSSYLDGYQVRDQKPRRGGSVLFEIFKDYQPHFERYLAWRRELFPDSTQVFPFIKKNGARKDAVFMSDRLRLICSKLLINFVPPSHLRNTRVNWLLRRSGDPDLTAEMEQSTKQTLLGVYERASQQRAIVESARFWLRVEPTIGREQSVGPGACTGNAEPAPSIPAVAPTPDCRRASGCLWCTDHRDFDSFDYVWSLASFRCLKAFEANKIVLPNADAEPSPSQHAVDRITSKLRWFERSNDQRRGWLEESMARIEEGDLHPDWRYPISMHQED